MLLSLFGPVLQICDHESAGPALRSSKCVGLLAFLALERGPHSREKLANLLWGDADEAAARASLRQAIKLLRAPLGQALHAGRETIELAASTPCDVREFLTACDSRSTTAPAFQVERFLSGFVVPRAPAFEEWLEGARESLRRRHIDVLRATARDMMAAARWREAAVMASRWLQHDPASPDALRFVAASEAAASAGASPTAAVQFEADLVGRADQWGELTVLWEDVTGGHGRVALLEGEVGLGKTRLAAEWLRWVRVQGGTVLRGRGYDAASGVPYGPIAAVLRDALAAPGVLGAAPEHLAEIAWLIPELRQTVPALRDAVPPVAPGGVERTRLFEAVAQVFFALADEQPTVLWIDDLHRCDAETCNLLHFLAQRLGTSPLGLLIAVHPGDLDRDAPASRMCGELRSRGLAGSVKLTPLDESDVHRIVRQLGRVRSDDGAVQLAAGLHAATDGNPLHLIEMLKALVLDGSIGVHPETGEWFEARASDTADGYNVPMPALIKDEIAHRVAMLPELHREVIATVSVVGTGCLAELVARIHDLPRLRAALLCDELVERRLLREADGAYLGAHPVITNVVRSTLSTSRRREIHRAIAAGLAAITPESVVAELAGEIARHAQRGRDRAMTFRYAMLASDDAVRHSAFDEAELWLQLASSAGDPGEQANVLEQRLAELRDLAAQGNAIPAAGRRRSTGGFGKLELDLS